MTEYLDLADYLLIAEAVLGVPAEEIARWPEIALADSALHAPVLCAHLARNHPLPDGNKRVAYLALLELLARNGVEWAPPSVEETVATIERVASGTISEREIADWLRSTRA